MNDPNVRHFILCQKSEFDESGTFDAKGVYEYFVASSFPASTVFHAVLGVTSLNPGISYNLVMRAFQDMVEIAMWNGTFTVDKQNEIMNIRLASDALILKHEGTMTFRVELNGKSISDQHVEIRKGVK